MNNTIVVPFIPERVAEFLVAQTIPGDRVEAKLCFSRFEKWLPGKERYAWTRNRFYSELRTREYLVKPRTANKMMIHGLALKASDDAS